MKQSFIQPTMMKLCREQLTFYRLRNLFIRPFFPALE